ncbi:predicted protein [Naegleria gruberi]|uniref:very-long-chain (3R)-3-hydroxyacyl-CoA dehydratase n=1 Tax=Naegleria gruberi TaxID=5762 RepID=D2VF48_NAEGR|nr:uncharacterized protein NAEGRDRAFT_33547 [Naegleria gruberi]EFC44621.1 predicted protein [Naegleria gruberi]|eukprot:XP_002677365.1 predicted protein [Naegleria gruberi strain NEG-M]
MAVVSSKNYLTLYNSLATLEWIYLLLFRTLQPLIQRHSSRLKVNKQAADRIALRKPSLWQLNGGFLKYIQTQALLESVHSFFGITSSPVRTTFGQTCGRLFITHLIGDDLPTNDLLSDCLMTTLQLSWSAADIVRYLFYLGQLWKLDQTHPKVASILKFLRYNAFLVLYPVGMLSEVSMKRRKPVVKKPPYPLVKKFMIVFFFLFIVCVGYPTVYLHMLSQRRKSMK